MKLKSLILGSVAAAGLSTAGFAADLGVLTSLDVCDELGLSGLTISSDTNCLQISGKVTYEFNWGNYDGKQAIATTQFGVRNIDVPSALAPASDNDWASKVETWLKFVGTASSDFGPASTTIVLRQRDYTKVENAIVGVDGDAHALRFQEAWVSVGDSTVLAAGKKGSIFNDGDDEPFNFTGLFISSAVDAGVSKGAPKTGGHVIQLWSNVGEGLIAKIGLEALDLTGSTAGTLVGVLDYSGSGITAHISGAVGGLLDGVQTTDDNYAIHAGFTGTFDQFKLRAALGAGGAYAPGGNSSYWNALVTGEAKFDMFKVALSGEASGGVAAGGGALDTDYGFGASFGATVADGIEINIGGRYFNDGTAGVADGYQIAAQLIASLTETVKLTTEIGVYGLTPAPAAPAFSSDFYGKAELAWTPGGGFSSSVGATVQQNGAYKVTFKAAKAFQ
ncbi:hypothetical protein ASD04_03545 [Devosia sp. Root436]|uniref:hypothetical protein n=1 Tax=Devosia sp. Root436 TaxID=1736537 RepID=UPI0006FFD441|nr:hypothetical protein [Devosia sp. Root436]KQX43033.1 hypothetical protein ASD04_03545 [Devosia sp. Root436]